MSFFFTLLNSAAYLDFPNSIAGGLLFVFFWLGLFGIITGLLIQWRGFNKRKDNRFWYKIFGLAVCIPITNLFLGVRISATGALPTPGVPVESPGSYLMVFSNVPWILAGGIIGPVPSVALAFFSGIFSAFWGTHNPLTPLELALLAILFSRAVHQRYRSRVFILLRYPMFVVVLLALLYPLFYLMDTSLLVSGSTASRLDYAFTHSWVACIAMAIELIIAGAFAQVISIVYPSVWGSRGSLLPAPTELSLRNRFLYTLVPVLFLLGLGLIIGAWRLAERTARAMIRDRLSNIAMVTSQSVPNLLETGQNLVEQLANDKRLYSTSTMEIIGVLEDDLRTVPFFNQLFLLDATGSSIGGYPLNDYRIANTTEEEKTGIEKAKAGIPFQLYTVPPLGNGNAAFISFIEIIYDEIGQMRGILIGRTDLAANPFSQTIIHSLVGMTEQDGLGLLLDENNRILYHPNPDLVMNKYTGRVTEVPDFFDEIGSDGTRRLVFSQKVEGRPWAVVLSVPARQAQELALGIAVPLLGIVLLLSIIGITVLLVSLSRVTSSLETLASQASNITDGQLDQPIQVIGEDELGRLRRTFEQMRLGLKARMEESNRLLWVSQGVASSLDVTKAVKPVLESVLFTGACAARIVLAPSIMPELEGDIQRPVTYSAGPAGDLFSRLDAQILTLTQEHERLVLTSLYRPRLLSFTSEMPIPASLIAIALRHESLYYGALWAAYDQSHRFSLEEVQYLATLASQAALAAANARHYLYAEIGRQRLEAVLTSTSDPVLVIDQKGCLLIANPAAWKAIGLNIDWQEGDKIEHIISNLELREILKSPSDEKQVMELTLADGKVYSATVSTVMADGHPVGRVCVLRDVTYFKNIDELKSDFVATVSHDLRTPLSMMRGYANMLEMFGELNEQQDNYVRKIGDAIDDMLHLVNNLLDLGRIEAGISLKLELVSPTDILERVIQGLQLKAAQKRIQLSMDLPEEPLPSLEADPALLLKALNNLVDNAIKFTETGGETKVSAELAQDSMIFKVQDFGIGIAPVDQTRLFDKFYQPTHVGIRPTGGMGLGLAIVKSIAERHGGQVSVESQLGKGSTFILEIPVHQNTEQNP